MQFLRARLLPLLLRGLAAIVLIAVTRLLLQPFESALQIQIVALLFLLPVTIATALWGLTPGVLAAFVAFLVFNYFYIQPFHTFQVHQTQDLITLMIFLIVAVVTSQLIGQARAGVQLAQAREWEATRMYELISALAGLQDAQSIAQVLAGHTLETFRFDRVEVFIEGRGGEPALTAAAPEAARGSGPAGPKAAPALPQRPTARRSLLTARGAEGDLRLWHSRPGLSNQEQRLLEAYASQGALALERVRLARGEHKARLLEESDQMKTSLLNSVSHELRSPLAAIKASVSSLRTGAVEWDTAARQDLLATVEEETDHLNLLVGNLLDMSRIESGAFKPHQRWNAVGEIAQGVATKMRKQLAGHRLELDFPPDLPLAPTDYVMIEQVFTNLISNSVKYAPPETVITITGRQEGEWLHTRVTNQGPPVPDTHLERIFDKFYRLSEADRVTGTGLGLSICKGIVEQHGGKIWAENGPGCFIFHFTLPVTLNGALPDAPREAGDG